MIRFISTIERTHFPTLREAIKAGKNAGVMEVVTPEGPRMLHWRLRGDAVETNKHRDLGWELLEPDLLDVDPCDGVLAVRERWDIGIKIGVIKLRRRAAQESPAQ